MFKKDIDFPSEVDKLAVIIDDLVLHNDMQQLKKYAFAIDRRIKLSNIDRETKEALSLQLVRCQLMSMPMQSFQILQQMCMTQIVLSSKIDNFDWKDKIDGFLVTIPSLEERDRLKQKLIVSFSQNREIVSNESNVPSTVGEWVSLFNNQIKNSGDNALQLLNITKDEKFRRLSSENKVILNNIFRIVSYLHRSSVEMESDTEAVTLDTGIDGELLEFRGGNFYPVTGTKTDINSPRQDDNVEDRNLLSIGAGLSKELARDEIQKMSKLLVDSVNTDSLLKRLSPSLLSKNNSETVSILLTMARKGAISLLLKDSSVVKLLKVSNNKSSNSIRENTLHEELSLSQALYLLLVEYIHLDQSEAAHVASDLVAMARDKGEKIEHVSYYDESDGQYHWL